MVATGRRANKKKKGESGAATIPLLTKQNGPFSSLPRSAPLSSERVHHADDAPAARAAGERRGEGGGPFVSHAREARCPLPPPPSFQLPLATPRRARARPTPASALLKVRPYTVTNNDTLESIAAKRGEKEGGGGAERFPSCALFPAPHRPPLLDPTPPPGPARSAAWQTPPTSAQRGGRQAKKTATRPVR
jgi:hypothetical protein